MAEYGTYFLISYVDCNSCHIYDHGSSVFQTDKQKTLA